MKLSSLDFHKQALNTIQTAINGAKEYGLEISTMPPQLSVISSQPALCDYESSAIVVYSTLPEILQDIDPNMWSLIATVKMYESQNSEGFVFWCLVEDQKNMRESVFGFSYQKGGDIKGFLCTTNFTDIKSVSPFKVVPCLDADYEMGLVVH